MRLAFVCLCAWLVALACAVPSKHKTTGRFVAPPLLPDGGAAQEALDEVNAARAKRHLPPLLRDAWLTEGAKAAAAYRAEHLIKDHTRNDFSFLPAGVKADAAGCAALKPEDGFGSCCMYERKWTFAGAASCAGKDGLVYHHLFVR